MIRKGFTLIELIVVIAIIAILAAIVAPNAFRAVEKAKISGTVEDYRSIKTAAMAYYSDVGQWIANCTNTSFCQASGFVAAPNATTSWDGPYLEKWPQQAKWGGDYSWTSGSGTVFCTGGGSCSSVGERFVTVSNVPQTAAQKIDQQLDGTANGVAGMVRYGNATTETVNIMVSRDGISN
jgi:general secretion pathway protein G